MSEASNPVVEGSLRERAARRLPSHTFSDLLVPVSSALDLAEGHAAGHAQRVTYIATSLGIALGLDAPTQLACNYAGLMHDIGVVPAGAGLGAYTRGDERMVFASLPLLSPEEAAVGASDSPEIVIERIVDHVIHGARTAREFGLPAETIKGISAHHEHWDGTGYPHGLKGEDIPILGRIICLADHIESMIDQAGPLLGRRNLPLWLNQLSGIEADPNLVSVLRDLASGDQFWLGLFSADLPGEISLGCSRLREPKGMRLLGFSESLSQLVDSRFSFTVGVSARVARYSEALGRAVSLPDLRLKQLRIAALLHDLGQVSVSERIMAKPGILSVEELEVLRNHPAYSRDVVAGIYGLEEVADWVAAHHERMDGRGYPDGRAGNEIPFEARILAVADAYVAMTSDRPHRPRADDADAQQRLRGAAGSQLDGDLVEIFLRQVVS
ncbi:MAG: HD domain-containing protein [Dehalococcoidia bacterium]|nr:HD domain-containing protein [Dehalococcoidia bacterium]